MAMWALRVYEHMYVLLIVATDVRQDIVDKEYLGKMLKAQQTGLLNSWRN